MKMCGCANERDHSTEQKREMASAKNRSDLTAIYSLFEGFSTPNFLRSTISIITLNGLWCQRILNEFVGSTQIKSKR